MIEEEELVATPHAISHSFAQNLPTPTASNQKGGGIQSKYRALMAKRGWASSNKTQRDSSQYPRSDNDDDNLTSDRNYFQPRFLHDGQDGDDESPKKHWAMESIANDNAGAIDEHMHQQVNAKQSVVNHAAKQQTAMSQVQSNRDTAPDDDGGFCIIYKGPSRTKLVELQKQRGNRYNDLGTSSHQFSMQDLERASSFPDSQQYPEMSLGTESETSTSEDEKDRAGEAKNPTSPNTERYSVGYRKESHATDREGEQQNDNRADENQSVTRDQTSWKSQRMNASTSLMYNDHAGFLDDGEEDDDVEANNDRASPNLQLLETALVPSQTSLVGPGRTFEEIYKELENEEEEERSTWKPRSIDDSPGHHPLHLYQSSLSTSYDEEDTGCTSCVMSNTMQASCLEPNETISGESTSTSEKSSSATNNGRYTSRRPTSFDREEATKNKNVVVPNENNPLIQNDTEPTQNSLFADLVDHNESTIRNGDYKSDESPLSRVGDGSTIPNMDRTLINHLQPNLDLVEHRVSSPNPESIHDERLLPNEDDDPSSILRYLSSAQSEEDCTDDCESETSSPRHAIPTITVFTNRQLGSSTNFQNEQSPNPLVADASTGTTPRMRNVANKTSLVVESTPQEEGALKAIDAVQHPQNVPASSSDNTNKQTNRSPVSKALGRRQFQRQQDSSNFPVIRLKSNDLHDIYDDLEVSDPRYVETKSVGDTISMLTFDPNFSVDGTANVATRERPYDKSGFVGKTSSHSKSSRSKTNRRRSLCVRVVIPCLILLLIIAIIIGGICGSGKCMRRSSTETSNNVPNPPWIDEEGPVSVYIPFQSTEEFHTAIDSYLTSNNKSAKYGKRIGDWDVSLLSDFAQAFDAEREPPLDARSQFNEDISRWNVSRALSLRAMFRNTVHFDQDIEGWDVSNVNDMSYMFQSALSFNKSLSSWNVSNVKDMSYMFKEAVLFNGNLSNWDVGNVDDMYSMFARATSFNSDISKWNVSSVTDMAFMFNRASSFNGDISKWKVSNVASMQVMFQRADMFNSDLSKWDVSNTVDMKYMFYGASKFNSDLENWNVSRVTNMFSMFNQATSFDGNVSKWNVGNVVDMDSMFQLATSFQGDLSSWKVDKCVNMAYMFFGARKFNSNISDWDVSSVETMHRMFRHAQKFNQNLARWNVTNLIDAAYMFANATSFDQNLCKWGRIFSDNKISNSTRVADTSDMFLYTNCPSALSPNVSKGFGKGPWCYSCEDR